MTLKPHYAPDTGNFLTEDDLYEFKERKCSKCNKILTECLCEEE